MREFIDNSYNLSEDILKITKRFMTNNKPCDGCLDSPWQFNKPPRMEAIEKIQKEMLNEQGNLKRR